MARSLSMPVKPSSQVCGSLPYISRKNASQNGRDRRSESTNLLHLGRRLDQLGAYAQARDYCRQAQTIRQELGDRQGESWATAYVALVNHHLGHDTIAQTLGQAALELAQAIATRPEQALAWTVLGHALTSLAALAAAGHAYRQALTLRQALDQPHLALEPLAGLARLALTSGDLPQAGQHVEIILTTLETRPLHGLDEPFRVYLTCYQVLQAAADDRAKRILHTAHTLLQERAGHIPETSLRRSFLERVPSQRALLEAWREQMI